MGIPRYSGLISYSKSARYSSHKRLETVKWCKRLHKPIEKQHILSSNRRLMTDNQGSPGIEQHQLPQRSHITYAYRDTIMETSSMWIILSGHRLDRAWRFHAPAARFGVEDFADMSDPETAL
ncbi:hypothetical protein GJ744_009343 [Endocarpon pusillum]|uniref:Uncharacterized protein n=1 Tax=Endocarpon pusillum TaxID=364733 RepID=A0A8H7AI75_9EURO|nr:hypothetical protein GJ744_009343 [Endocarpon pusillum]